MLRDDALVDHDVAASASDDDSLVFLLSVRSFVAAAAVSFMFLPVVEKTMSKQDESVILIIL